MCTKINIVGDLKAPKRASVLAGNEGALQNPLVSLLFIANMQSWVSLPAQIQMQLFLLLAWLHEQCPFWSVSQASCAKRCLVQCFLSINA